MRNQSKNDAMVCEKMVPFQSFYAVISIVSSTHLRQIGVWFASFCTTTWLLFYGKVRWIVILSLFFVILFCRWWVDEVLNICIQSLQLQRANSVSFHLLWRLEIMAFHAHFSPIGFHAPSALLPNAAWFAHLEEHIFKFLIEERKRQQQQTEADEDHNLAECCHWPYVNED